LSVVLLSWDGDPLPGRFGIGCERRLFTSFGVLAMKFPFTSLWLRIVQVSAVCALVAACGGGSMPDGAADAADAGTVATPDASTSQVNPGVRPRRADAAPTIGG
jgi:hypothetical protein